MDHPNHHSLFDLGLPGKLKEFSSATEAPKDRNVNISIKVLTLASHLALGFGLLGGVVSFIFLLPGSSRYVKFLPFG